MRYALLEDVLCLFSVVYFVLALLFVSFTIVSCTVANDICSFLGVIEFNESTYTDSPATACALEPGPVSSSSTVGSTSGASKATGK